MGLAKSFAKIILLGSQVVGRAVGKTLQGEINASKEAAKEFSRNPETNKQQVYAGLTMKEAMEILNVNKTDPEIINKNYEHLFQVNDRAKGGSFYLQSKIVRAKERIDMEFKEIKQKSI